MLAAAVLAGACAGCSVQTLGAPKGDFTLYAVFGDVQNLVTGHSVQLADVRIGTVVGVQLQGYKVRVRMSIVNGRRVPAGTSAAIAKTSLLGENYVRLTPPKGTMAAGPYLAQRATITQTTLAPDLESVTERVAPILAAVGGQDLDAIVTTLASATQAKGPQLNRIIQRSTQLSDSYAAAATDLGKVIDGLARLSGALENSSRELDRLPGMVSLATQRVHKDRAELKASVRQLVRLGTSFNATFHDRHAARLRSLLLRIDQIMTSMTRGKQQLKEVVDLLDKGLVNAPSLTYDGQALAHAWIAGFLPDTGPKTPQDPARELRRLLAPGQ
jgi:phospholipid/cholesterol/gamma-HCH transport system substrate-binding protein